MTGLFSRHFDGDSDCTECVMNGFPEFHKLCPDAHYAEGHGPMVHVEWGPAEIGFRAVTRCDTCGEEGTT